MGGAKPWCLEMHYMHFQLPVFSISSNPLELRKMCPETLLQAWCLAYFPNVAHLHFLTTTL